MGHHEMRRACATRGSTSAGIATSKSLPRSPYKVSYILPLIAKTIAETPMASNKVLRQLLEPFGRAYCFTDAIIQGARTDARRLIFGDADDNVTYARGSREGRSSRGIILYYAQGNDDQPRQNHPR